MQDFKLREPQSTGDPQERSRRLAQVYSTILSWPIHRETETELASEDLRGDTEASPASEISGSENIAINSNIIQEVSRGTQVDGLSKNEREKKSYQE